MLLLLLPSCCSSTLDPAPAIADAMDGSCAPPLGSVSPVPVPLLYLRKLLPGLLPGLLPVLLAGPSGSCQTRTLLLLSTPPSAAAADEDGRLLSGAPCAGRVCAPRTAGPCLAGLLSLVPLMPLMLLTMLLVLSLRMCSDWLGRLWDRLLRLLARPRRPVRSACSCSASCKSDSCSETQAELGRTNGQSPSDSDFQQRCHIMDSAATAGDLYILSPGNCKQLQEYVRQLQEMTELPSGTGCLYQNWWMCVTGSLYVIVSTLPHSLLYL